MGSPVSCRRAKQEVMKPFGPVLLGLHLPSGRLSDFISHTWPAPGASSVHAPLSQGGSRSEGFWEEQDSL